MSLSLSSSEFFSSFYFFFLSNQRPKKSRIEAALPTSSAAAAASAAAADLRKPLSGRIRVAPRSASLFDDDDFVNLTGMKYIIHTLWTQLTYIFYIQYMQ